MEWKDSLLAAFHRSGMTKSKLAELSETNEKTLRRWFGKKNSEAPRIDDAIRLARAMRMTVDEVFVFGGPLQSGVVDRNELVQRLLQAQLKTRPAAGRKAVGKS